MSERIVPRRVYVTVFALLIFFTIVTVWAAFADLGRLNLAVALGIATLKATLVILYFMHVRYNPRLIWLTLALAVSWLGMLLISVLTDYASRGWIPFPGK
ncbi:MAG TPA: cytochrome C oxidase subunit IV family protein [Candidatus Polarisedimenticolia bacterium]|jgi:cytochrome c oxidase subunit 4|nr:cytochrome C oxidase subunit IV family protein [Candidatus Polarisedimenticolia bacterium]